MKFKNVKELPCDEDTLVKGDLILAGTHFYLIGKGGKNCISIEYQTSFINIYNCNLHPAVFYTDCNIVRKS